MRPWPLRLKLITLVVALVIGATLLASVCYEWLAFQALKEDVRTRAAFVASEIAFGINTVQELHSPEPLALEIRNIMAARPTLRWLDIYAARPDGLFSVASSREEFPGHAPDLVLQAFAQGRTLTAAGLAKGGQVWLAAAPVHIAGVPSGAVSLALSLEGAERLTASLRQQLLVVLLAAGVTIVASISLFAEWSINRPIRALLDSMAAVKEGNFSVSLRLARRDEMGQLADGLESMLHRIRLSHEENARLLEQIQRFNQELQLRVAEATQELESRNEALERANELLFDLQRRMGRAQRLATIGQVTAAVSHEIGAPLNAMAVHLQLLERSPGLTDQDRERLARIDGQVQRLVKTVRQILTLTRRETDRAEPTDLNRLVRGVTDLMAPIFAAKRIICTFGMDETLPRVEVVGHQIQQVVLNLLTNAVDAMPAGGKLRVESGRADGTAFLRIADSGPGIPPAAYDQIFEPFFSTKEEGGGAGLGLAIGRQIVEAHRGSISVRETPGGGATFEVRLPIAPEETRG